MIAPVVEELRSNGLLARLQEADRIRLQPHFTVVDLAQNDVLQKAGEEVVDTYFPCGSAMASFNVWVDEDRPGIEVALVGREGAIGGIVSNGRVPAFATASVRTAGRFLRIKVATLENLKLESIALRHWFARYSDCLIAQVFQTAACNATHTILQRTAKWLIAAGARTSSPEFEMTQDQLAEMLGVGRTFVTRVVRQLREEGIIDTRRGIFIVKDEQALRAKSCLCTTAIENHFDAVLHGIYPAA
ncbi:Crp/Fnr family transcriptional regulator [Hyphomicrobium sp.]|uniref:Crp/Fnr family transcriptional regulator n=1 Tax=Hyphomicrobium sp. TaxID=82 RepID=UPI000FAF5046|nr:Crp/Fnr family transcriptional regulator [Hyphomicrobium sp.]RUO98466.1 MAG: Crp/Fnr family transcriptional regulator [Hyphomicrobium sp.]